MSHLSALISVQVLTDIIPLPPNVTARSHFRIEGTEALVLGACPEGCQAILYIFVLRLVCRQ